MPLIQAVLSLNNITDIQEVGRWGKGTIIDALYSPNGTELIVATALGVYVYDAETAVQLLFIPVENIQLASIALSPNGQLVAMGIAPDWIEVRQVSDGSLQNTFTAPNGIGSLTFTIDGQHLLAPYAAWRINDGTFVSSTYSMSTLSVNGITVITRGEQEFEVAELITENEISISPTGVVIPDDSYSLTRTTLSPDGKLFAIGDWGSTAEVYRVADGTLLCSLNFVPPTAFAPRRQLSSRKHNNSPGPYLVHGLEFTPDSETLAVASGFKEVTLWQMADCQLSQRILDASGDIIFSDDGHKMAVWADTVTQWDMPSGTRLNQLKQHTGWVNDLAFTSTSSRLAIASSSFYLRSVVDGGLLTSLPNKTNNLAITSDDQTLLLNSDNGDLIFYNLVENTSFSVVVTTSPWEVNDISLSSDGQMVATVSGDDAVRVWRVSDGQLLSEGYSINGQAVTFSPAEPFFAFYGAEYRQEEGTIDLWTTPNLSTMEEEVWPNDHSPNHVLVHSLDIPDGYNNLRSLIFSPDGTFLAAGFSSGHILIWRVSDEELVLILQDHTNTVTGLAFSPSGHILASVSYDGTLRFWRAADGMLLNSIPFPSLRLLTVVFSPDGRFLATGSTDGLVRLWGVP